jgi:hypothetical protein
VVDQGGARPSRESLREVKREYRQRRRAARRGPRPPRGAHGSGGGARGLLVLLAGLLALGVAGYAASRHRTAAAAPVLTPTAAPVVVPSYTPPPTTAPVDPFAGTAVAAWPVGAAGLRVPAAAPVAGFTAAQVADAYARTTRYLRAAMLDTAVLWHGDMRPVRAALLPDSARHWAAGESDDLATRFATDVRPASPSIRLNGDLHARPAPDRRLYVDFRYVATYAVRPASADGTMELVAIRRTGTLLYDAAGRGRVGAPWVYRSQYTSDHSACGRRYPHPGYVEVFLGDSARSASPEPTPSAAHETYNILDPRRPEPKGCFTNTGAL